MSGKATAQDLSNIKSELETNFKEFLQAHYDQEKIDMVSDPMILRQGRKPNDE
jgi:hypothetical protein